MQGCGCAPAGAFWCRRGLLLQGVHRCPPAHALCVFVLRCVRGNAVVSFCSSGGAQARLGRERRDKLQSSIVLQSPMKKGDQYVGKEPHRGAQLQEEGLSSSMGGRQNAPDAR
jgi:hypothetical protein